LSITIADFGVAVQLTRTMPKRRTVIGTPYWMAPEVLATNAEYNEKADIWSIGITAIELACGDPPNADIPPMKAIFVIPTQPSPTLPQPHLWSDDFKDFVRVCLLKDPEERPAASSLLRHHPFITKAADQMLIARLVGESLQEIEEYRALETRVEQERRVGCRSPSNDQ
jgi:serine/threonine protein kinase